MKKLINSTAPFLFIVGAWISMASLAKADSTLTVTCTPGTLNLDEAGNPSDVKCTVNNLLGFSMTVNVGLSLVGDRSHIDNEDPLTNANPAPSACNGAPLGGKGKDVKVSCNFTFTFTPGGEMPEVGNDKPSDQQPEYAYAVFATSATSNGKYNAPAFPLIVNVLDPTPVQATPEPSSELLVLAGVAIGLAGVLSSRCKRWHPKQHAS